MFNVLNHADLALSVYNLVLPSESSILEITSDISNSNNILIYFFFNGFQVKDTNKNEYQKYFINLLHLIIKCNNLQLSDGELQLYEAFVLSDYCNQSLETKYISDLINIYKEALNINIDNKNDALWWAKEKIKYSLLSIYIQNISLYFDEATSLLNELKENQARYKEISNRITKELIY